MNQNMRSILLKLPEDVYKKTAEYAKALTEELGRNYTPGDIVRLAVTYAFLTDVWKLEDRE